MKLGLGSAQFGMDYGVTNPSGKVAGAEVRRILELAAELGVRVLDTAPGYGDSERAIGAALPENHPFRVVTKTRVFNTNRIARDDARAVESDLRESIARLNQERLYGLLIHHAEDLLVPGGEHLIEAMEHCVDGGLVSKIGVSVYTAKQIDGVLRLFQPGIVQLPISVFDQRLVQSGHLARLHQMGVEVHARSVFLQGVLLADAATLPTFLGPLRTTLEAFHSRLRAAGISPLTASLAFVARRPEISTAIVGVTSRDELLQIVTAAGAAEALDLDFRSFAEHDEALLNPAKWNAAPAETAGVMK